MRKNKAAIEFYCQGKNYRLSVIKVLNSRILSSGKGAEWLSLLNYILCPLQKIYLFS